MKGPLGAATVTGSLMYGAGHVFKVKPTSFCAMSLLVVIKVSIGL